MGTDAPVEDGEQPTTDEAAEVMAVTDPYLDAQNRSLALSMAVQGKALPGEETVTAATLYYEFLNA